MKRHDFNLNLCVCGASDGTGVGEPRRTSIRILCILANPKYRDPHRCQMMIHWTQSPYFARQFMAPQYVVDKGK
jgi:hypothetical protein